MATNYSDLYPHIRVLIGDTDASYYTWLDAVLDDAIDFALLTNSDYAAGGGNTITPDVADDNDLAVIVLTAARVLLNPSPGRFSYRTRALSVSRDSSGKVSILSFIEDKLYELQSGGSIVSKDSSLIAYLEHATRYLDTFNEADLSG